MVTNLKMKQFQRIECPRVTTHIARGRHAVESLRFWDVETRGWSLPSTLNVDLGLCRLEIIEFERVFSLDLVNCQGVLIIIV